MEDDITNLKEDIDKLKSDVAIKQNKLSEYAVKEFEMTKLLSDAKGKAVEEANLKNIVQDIIAKNKWLKDILKSIKKHMIMII